jgi:hypothetical protein
MFIGWRGRRLKSKSTITIQTLNVCILIQRRARLAKIKQGEAKALGKKGKLLGRHDHV